MADREGYHRKSGKWEPSPAQRRVLDLLGDSRSNAEIAVRLGVSPETVKTHVSQMLSETGTADREALAAWWRSARTRRSRLAGLAVLWHWQDLQPLAARLAGATAVIAVVVTVVAVMTAQGMEPKERASSAAPAAFAPSATPPLELPPPLAFSPPLAFFPPLFATAHNSGLERTLRISGADLPYPVLVTAAEYFLATNVSADSFNSWWVKDNLPSPQADAGPRYQLDLALLDGSGQVVGSEALYVYVAADPPLVGKDDRWRQPNQWYDGLIRRYIELGRRRLIGPAPTLAEVLRVSAQALGSHVTLGQVSIDAETVPERVLSPPEATLLLEQLAPSERAVFGVRGTLLGRKGYTSVEVRIDFGQYAGPRFFYMLAGSMAPYGMGIAPRNLGAWSYSPYASPPIYSQGVLMLPAAFDEMMEDLGYRRRPLTGVADYRIVPFSHAQSDVRRTLAVAVWREGTPNDKVRVPVHLCPDGCDVSATIVTLPLAGPRYVVQIEYAGVEPYPEDIEQPRYDYFPHEASCPTLVQTQSLRIGGGMWGISHPFCAPPELESVLSEAISRLP